MLAFGIMVAALPTARAADTTCTSFLANTTVNGNLTVPAGQSCTLTGVTVTGNVQVQTNAELDVEDQTTIVGNLSVGTGATLLAPIGGMALTVDGNFDANQCFRVRTGIQGSFITVDGNAQIQYCDAVFLEQSNVRGNFACNNSSAVCQVVASKLNGNVEVNDNSSAAVVDNTISNNLEVNDNSSAGVSNNTIGNNLGCQGNASISGSGNSVGGHKSGQCANF